MYSPKIREDLIPRIYWQAKAAQVPMTVWVNRRLAQALAGEEDDAARKEDTIGTDATTRESHLSPGGTP